MTALTQHGHRRRDGTRFDHRHEMRGPHGHGASSFERVEIIYTRSGELCHCEDPHANHEAFMSDKGAGAHFPQEIARVGTL